MPEETLTKFPDFDFETEFLADMENVQHDQKLMRKLLVTLLNVGKTYTSDKDNMDFEAMGRGSESSTLEFSPEVNSVTDIYDITETTVDKLEIKQSFDPVTARVGSKTHKTMLKAIAKKDNSRFSMFDVLVIHLYWSRKFGDKYYYFTELHKNSTVYPKSWGGKSWLDMPLEVNFSNDKVLGWADYDKEKRTVKFYAVGDDIPTTTVTE